MPKRLDAADAELTASEFERTSRLAPDLDLELIVSEEEDYESAPPNYRIATYPADYTLEVLYQKWRNEEIEIPDFQRNFVWKQVQSSKLIESFLVGLPVPAVFLYNDRDSQKYLVIDGQQRLKSIFYFFQGDFGEERKNRRKTFELTGINQESSYYRKTFDDLQDEDRRRLKNAVLRAFIVQQLDPEDDTSMYHIFERLNTGGTLLANQEICNCVYHGRFSEFLEEMNEFPVWRKVLGKPDSDIRSKDIELLVRFFAMRNVAEYRKPLKDFLSKFMHKNRNSSEEKLTESCTIFERTCEAVVENLGEKPFHVRSGLNAAVFDAVMSSFSENLDKIPEDVRARYEKLKKDDEFIDAISQGTTDVDKVRKRLRMSMKHLFDEEI